MAHPIEGTTPIGTLVQEQLPLLLYLGGQDPVSDGGPGTELPFYVCTSFARAACFSVSANGKGLGPVFRNSR